LAFDYIIVGAGTAGCVLANRLSADPEVEVLLIEAGGKDNYFWIDIPVGYLYTIGNPRTDWCYRIEPDPGLNGRSIGYARGKVLGGCSSINAMIYMRGQRADYDRWAALGNRGWSWDDVLPVFKRSEDYQHGADEFHGAGGELRVEERRVSWEILDAWRDAAAACGIPKIDEFNRGDNFGNAYFQMNQRRGRRWSATRAFLSPALERANLRVMTDTEIAAVALERRDDGGWRAVGVKPSADLKQLGSEPFASKEKGSDPNFSDRDVSAPALLRARREVILAAGSIGSPAILQRSGIGPGDVLFAAGVPVRHELPGVGENLQDHLQVRTIYSVQNTVTLNRRAKTLFGRLGMGLEYLLWRTGPLTMPPSQLGAFTRSDQSLAAPNLEWHVQPLSLDSFGEPLHVFDAITPSVCNLKPTSRGRVRIVSPDPAVPPAITLNYLSTTDDCAVAVRGLKLTREIMAAEPLARFSPRELKPGPVADSDEALLDAARNLGTTIFHPVGTCRMGLPDPSLPVVDDRLRVHGVQNLRVVDASIMPEITAGNTNAPTVMIAEQGAEFIRREWDRRC
jgi:choline dehydrogenase